MLFEGFPALIFIIGRILLYMNIGGRSALAIKLERCTRFYFLEECPIPLRTLWPTLSGHRPGATNLLKA